MSIDHDQEICIGFRIKEDALLKAFEVEVTPAVYKYQDVYCSKTGVKLEPKRVLAKAEVVTYMFNGEDVDMINGTEALAKEVAEYLGVQYSLMGELNKDTYWIFGPKINTIPQKYGLSANFGPSLDYNSAVKAKSKLIKLGKGLTELGLKCEGPAIWNSVLVG